MPSLHRVTLRAVATGALLALVGAPLAAAPATAAVTTGTAIKIVQIGDSYSAGNGAGSYYGPADCYRSHDSWAAEYAQWLADGGNYVTFLTRACSGAVSADLRTPRKMDTQLRYVPGGTFGRTEEEGLQAAKDAKVCSTKYADEEYFEYSMAIWDTVRGVFAVNCQRYLRPQVEAVGKDTDLVVLTIGGNDLGFEGIVKECFVLGVRDPGSCRGAVQDARDGIGQLEDDIVALMADLRGRMRPDAQVLLLSYPYLSNEESYVLRSIRDRLPFVDGDTYDIGAEVRALGDEGDAAQRSAVDRANAAAGTPFVFFVSTVKEHFAGHEPNPSPYDRNDDRWIHEFDTFTKAEWYHPTKTGHFEESTLLRGTAVPGRVPSSRAGSIDLVFAIDTTGSMQWVLDEVKNTATQMVDHLAESSGSYRFGLVTFRDEPSTTGWDGDYPARVDLPFTTDLNQIRASLGAMRADGGGDWPETALSGMDTAISMPWRPGVRKILITISDAPAFDPEPVSGLTGADVVAHALAVDPVEIYPVDVSGGSFAPSVAGVAEGTGGWTTTSLDVAGTLLDTITAAMDKPYAWVAGPYTARVGDTLQLDARGSYATTGALVSYEWDLDGDGTYDTTTTEPVLTHTFDALVDGYLAVRVTDDSGRSSIATTQLAVTEDGDEIPADVDLCPQVADPGLQDADGDGLGDACDPDPYSAPEPSGLVVFDADAPGDVATSVLSGSVFVDADADGTRDTGEAPAAGVAVAVAGVDAGGLPASVEVTSAADGTWAATGLLPGTYDVRAAGATAVAAGRAVTGEGTAPGTLTDGAVTGAVLSGIGSSIDGVQLAVAGAATPGGSVPGGSAPGGSVPGGSAPGGSAPGGSVPGGPGASAPGAPVPVVAAAATPTPKASARPATSARLAATGTDGATALAWAMLAGLALAVGTIVVAAAGGAGRRES